MADEFKGVWDVQYFSVKGSAFVEASDSGRTIPAHGGAFTMTFPLLDGSPLSYSVTVTAPGNRPAFAGSTGTDPRFGCTAQLVESPLGDQQIAGVLWRVSDGVFIPAEDTATFVAIRQGSIDIEKDT